MALVVFSQLFDPSALTNVANTADQNLPGFPPAGMASPRIMADDFVLAAPTDVSLIRFFGGWFFDLPTGAPPSVPHIHLTIYPDAPGPGPEIFAADFGPVPGPPYVETPGVAVLGGGPGGYFLDSFVPTGPANPVVPSWTIVNMYECPISAGTLVLPPGTYWLGISVDLGAAFVTSRFGWCSADPGPPLFGSTCAFSPTAFLAPAAPPSWVPVPYPTGGPGPTHPLATTPMHLAFEIEGAPPVTTTTAPAGTTTTTVPATTPPPTTAPATTTGTPPEDWHATWSGPTIDPSQVTFGTAMVPPIPADFFEPGSAPFAGIVELEGHPVGPPGDTSTVVRRDADPFAPTDPPGGPVPVSIEIVALQLRSVAPITVTVGGPVTLWDVEVGLSPTPPPPPPGTLSATKTHPNGGTFTAEFSVQPLFTFTKVSGPGVPPGSVVTLDPGLLLLPPLVFSGSGDWVHSVNDPQIVHAPGAQWVSLINEAVPGVPASQVDSPMEAETFDGPGPSARHVVVPPRLPVTTPPPCNCDEPDRGDGTIEMPPALCWYENLLDVWRIIDGIPGGTIDIQAILQNFVSIAEAAGGSLGGTRTTFDSTLQMPMQGTGSLSGFTRFIGMPVSCVVDTSPRNPGDAVQDLETDFVSMTGTLFGDPDFQTLTVAVGTGQGLPASPGRTTLGRLGPPGSDFAVDSFFDITYKITFVGAVGSALDGMGGTTQGAIRIQTGPGDCLTTPPPTQQQADTNGDFRITSAEILAYANAFLTNDGAAFPGIVTSRSAYVLRAAAIFLANFQARYEDTGIGILVDDPSHPARWQELPDL